MRFIVGTGTTELHAHIDLDYRITATGQSRMLPAVTVLDVTCRDGQWAVWATTHTDTAEQETR
ncbi:hypothetical protein SAMN06265174_101800 [Dietzia kunjamensis subsp. schimae]|uniref:SnoaL-like domain-containing protein n=1 Tax=Dietzia kunjamensis subsp. schimae TaxID=498198 RepID=A0ABY1MY78_9ACTN|nr:hypothetical protein [Dietzia kunjamensis]MBB1015784.1 hypothetical protein [Dietzia kunjamensis subsp. schimae]SMO47419.1 hypothetical protein SAMN06265174_101800 [Dietzia kunjamensis subsp. schimae]